MSASSDESRSLERKFPEAPERGAPEPPPADAGVSDVGSPIPLQAQAHMSDDQWLSAMDRHRSDWSSMRNGETIGGAIELSRDLEKHVAAAPGRFAALAERMNADLPPPYFRAILRALAQRGADQSLAGTPAQIYSVIRRVRELGIEDVNIEISRAIGTVAADDIPEDIVETLSRIAANDPDPEADAWLEGDRSGSPSAHDVITQAINSVRGEAARGLAALLYEDRGRFRALRTAVRSVVTDRVLAVRSVAVECLTAVLDSHRNAAFELFDELMSDAGSILGTPYVDRFLQFAAFRDYRRVRRTLLGMLEAADDGAAQAAGRHLTLAGLWLEDASGDARGDAQRALEGNERGRVGATEVYAANLGDPSVGPRCAEMLPRLFNDESGDVRAAACCCFNALDPDVVADYPELISALAESPAFKEGVSFVLNRLEHSTQPLPASLCRIAERAVEEFGEEATSIQFRAAAEAQTLAKLITRLHEETTNADLKSQVLDAIDVMARAGFWGLDRELGSLDRSMASSPAG